MNHVLKRFPSSNPINLLKARTRRKMHLWAFIKDCKDDISHLKKKDPISMVPPTNYASFLPMANKGLVDDLPGCMNRSH